MSTTSTYQIFSDSNNVINLIFTYQDNIIDCKSIDNSELKLKNIEELEDYLFIDKEIKDKKYYINSLKLEDNYLTKVISAYSKKYNNGFIDWRYQYDELSFKKMKKLVFGFPIVIIVDVHPDGVGAAGGGMGNIVSKISKVAGYIYKIIKYAYIRKNTYTFFEENYNFNKDLIQKVIKREYTWKRGFIDTNIYENKKIYEKKIMKDCGYKYYKREKSWKKIINN